VDLAPSHLQRCADSATPAPVDLPGTTLRLEAARALLQHAGRAEPAALPDSLPYLQGLIDQLVELSSRDPLTGLANRRSFDLALAREVDRVARSGESALLLVADIDHFKRVNDAHGHAAGDEVIRAVGQALTDSVRPMDLVARVGGEEFAVLLPNCPASFGPQVAQRVRQRVADSAVQLGGTLALHVTISVGGAFAPQWVRSTPALWMERADQQLYRAKSEGRDRVCLEPMSGPAVSALERDLLLGGTPIQESE
jgi:diguanylate cyclase (GGDEF)-like protein